MYVLQIRHKGDPEWRTYYKYHKFYITVLFAYIKARFELLLINDVELRIKELDPPTRGNAGFDKHRNESRNHRRDGEEKRR